MCFFNRRQKENTQKPDKSSYEMAVQLLSYEGQIAWQMNVLFIGLNVGIGTIIQGYLDKINTHYILVGAFSLVGVIINIAWLGTFRRNNKYYNFRMAQAREAEPEGWRLLSDRGYRFSKGHEIESREDGLESSDRFHKLNTFERWASNKRAIGTAIWIFILGFVVLTIVSGTALFQQNRKASVPSANVVV